MNCQLVIVSLQIKNPMEQITPHIAAEVATQVNELVLYLQAILDETENGSTEYLLALYALDNCAEIQRLIRNQNYC